MIVVDIECSLSWGCMCFRCKDREHPLDIAARLSPEEIDEFARQAVIVYNLPSRGDKCVSCDSPGRLYSRGRFCDKHHESLLAYLSKHDPKQDINP